MWNTEFTGVWWNVPLMIDMLFGRNGTPKIFNDTYTKSVKLYKVSNIMSLSEPKSSACPQL